VPGGPSGDDGGLVAEIEPSASEISWGAEYSVTVTLVAESGYESDWTGTEIYWRGDGENWGVPGGEHTWDLQPGQSESHTFEIVPPETGDIAFFLADFMTGDVLAEWTLTVQPPVVALGETVPYYDGLEVTVDVQLTETIEAHIYDDEGADLGVYAIRPETGNQWTLAMITAENTANCELYPPDWHDVAVLVDGKQLDQARGILWASRNDFRTVDGTPDGAYRVDLDEKEGYYDPPMEILPTATAEGWLPYLAETDATKDDVAVVLLRETASFGTVTARWE
jgi:hypothetical protein